MSQAQQPNQDSSVRIGGNMTGSVIQTGNRNTASVQFRQASLPEPESVDIQSEVNALRELLTRLEAPDRRKLENALEDAQEEVAKPEPDKDEVGQALERALSYAQKASGFAEAIDKLRPPVEKTAGWLGQNWHKLLPMVGLAL